jgi:hypothetical protein
MKRLEFSARGRNRRLSVGDEIAMATHEARMAADQHQMATRVATQKALMGLAIVAVLVSVVMLALWAWHEPQTHVSAYGIPYHCDHSGRLPC